MYTEKKNMKYDFSWIEKEIRQWDPDILRDIYYTIFFLPSNLNWQVDLNGGFIKTHLGENIQNLNEYWTEREEFYNERIKTYKR